MPYMCEICADGMRGRCVYLSWRPSGPWQWLVRSASPADCQPRRGSISGIR
eukprot:COSAG05_NODE_21893_length_268_cov_0.923077_1_plen_50_part_10